jgi:hypothetical protein
MISNINKAKLIFITLILDILTFYTLYTNELNKLDKTFSIVVLLTHLIFYISLIMNKKKILDILHIFCFFLVSFSVYLENINLLLIGLLLIVIIQILWRLENKCILMDDGDTFGYGKTIDIITLIITILLSIKLGTKL